MKLNHIISYGTATIVALLMGHFCGAQSMEDWQDPNVFERNRLPMSTTFVTDQSEVQSLDGVWKFNFCPSVAGRLTGFQATNFDDSAWEDILVPGMMELQGYGDPIYVNIGYAWRDWYEGNPPFVPKAYNHVGQYRREFDIDPSWRGKQICLKVGSATSNLRVWINGKMVGYSEDSKLEARFDITKYVKPGHNIIAFEIMRWCDGTYLEDQDFNRFTGISRGVEIYTRERHGGIDDIHVLADMNGDIKVSTSTYGDAQSVRCTLVDAQGQQVGESFTSTSHVQGAHLWSAETPYLYTLKVEALDAKGRTCESTSLKVGFRSVEIKDAQLLVNGQPILIKGADRHEMSPIDGYNVSPEQMLDDIKTFKQLNMNAVRTSHYPNDPRWLALCDEYGLYVVDEGNIESHGMGYGDETLAQDPQYLQQHLIRDQRMVQRDFNHPSVIIWSMGNEAGNGDNFTACYKWIKSYDPSRPVHYERAEGGANSDIMCPMYVSPSWCERYASNNPQKPLIQCEYAHAMGNSMGNFKEYWDLIRKYPSYQGGFIWDFVDQAVKVRSPRAQDGFIWAYGGDFNDFDSSDGSFNCNGMVAPDRTWHPMAYEARYQHQDIHTSLCEGGVEVYNEYFFRDLSDVQMEWEVQRDGIISQRGTVESLSAEPQQTIKVALPVLNGIDCGEADTYLNIKYTLKSDRGLLSKGETIAYDQLCLHRASEVAAPASERAERVEVAFDYYSGGLSSYKVDGEELLASPIIPCFDRALTENDLGAGYSHELAAWRGVRLQVKSMTESRCGEDRIVRVEYEPIGAAIVVVTYQISPDGTVRGCEQMLDGGGLKQMPKMLRFGMRMDMPGQYDALSFYGLGPWENYIDRRSGALVGRYDQKVADQYHIDYVRPQESGTHTGLKWLQLCSAEGRGICIASEDFSASALPYSLEALDCAYHGDALEKNHNQQYGAALHSRELRPDGLTHVHFDLVQSGVGGIQSWGAEPLEQYQVPAEERTFNFVITPVIK